MTREEQFNDHVSRVKVKSRHGNKVLPFVHAIMTNMPL